jgi:glutathione synthase
MGLKVAVQMDPIENIDIRGDSTFALMLEAQARGHSIFVYHADSLALRDGTLTATGQDMKLRDEVGRHFEAGEMRVVDLSGLTRC